jgi:glycosyltransferase involved in cell wall biosynthesis
MMTPIPKVSVIIPCFNRERYIKQTIESVLGQTYPSIEIITIDDGSTDRTREVLDIFGTRLIVMEHPGRSNRGQSASINLGLKQARGEFIALLDSDDLFAPQKIERQVEFLQVHPDVGLVYGNGYAVDENGRTLYEIYPPGHQENSDPRRVLMDCYFLVPNNALVRKTAFDQAGPFDETLRAAQDHDMAIRLAEVTRIAYLDEHLFCYRRHPDSISARTADLRWRNGFRILDKAACRYPYPRGVVRRRRAVLHFRLGQCAFEKGDYLEGCRRMVMAGLTDPMRSLNVLAGHERITGPH